MADLKDQEVYKALESEILKNAKDKKNFLIISVPGLGLSYELKSISEAYVRKKINYISVNNVELSEFNILDLNFDKNTQAFSDVDNYFKLAKKDQKFAVVINDPSIIDSEEFKNAFFSSRVYSRYFWRPYTKKEYDVFAKSLNPKLNDMELEKLYNLTGGIARITKYFLVNNIDINVNIKDLVEDRDFREVLTSTTSVIAKVQKEYLGDLHLIKDGRFISEIVQTYFDLSPQDIVFDIKIEDDLRFRECGILSPEPLTYIEKNIVQELLDRGTISRDKISDFKWGEGSYDEYSDQAINKTMQRLARKLKQHKLIPIPKLGYKIIRRNE